MAIDDVEPVQPHPGPLAGAAGPARAGERPPASYCYLLDADADLAQELDLGMRVIARQAATVVVHELPVGECEPYSWLAPGTESPGLLLLEGLVAVDVRVGDRTATELMGPGDLLSPRDHGDDDLLERTTTWHVLTRTRVAVLDAGFAERIRPCPQILHALLRRAAKRASDLNVQRAITSQPRLDVRLALLLWHLAARWGRVEPGGIRLSLPLTHRLLGRLVGAERPSVSHALARLAEADLVTGRGDQWHLHGTLDEHLGLLVERGPGLRARARDHGASEPAPAASPRGDMRPDRAHGLTRLGGR